MLQWFFFKLHIIDQDIIMLYCESQIKDKNYTEADISLLTRDMIYTGKHQVNLALHAPLFLPSLLAGEKIIHKKCFLSPF